MSQYSPQVPMCGVHAAQVSDAYDKQLRLGLQRVAEHKALGALLDEQWRKEQALRDGRASAELIPSEGTVYYILVGKHIKIGYTANMARRVRAYPPDSTVLGVEWGGKTLERQRHQQFDAHRALGREWFLDVPVIRDHIAAVCVDWSPASRARSGPSGPARGTVRVKPRSGGRAWRVS